MANPFCHVELASTDVTKAKTFYSTLFDWKISDMDMGGGMVYSTFKPTDDSPGGGMMQHPVPGAPSSWLPYVLVDDINAANAKAKSLGAKIMKDTQEVPNMGWFSIIIDPTGAPLGLLQTMNKSHNTAFDPEGRRLPDVRDGLIVANVGFFSEPEPQPN